MSLNNEIALIKNEVQPCSKKINSLTNQINCSWVINDVNPIGTLLRETRDFSEDSEIGNIKWTLSVNEIYATPKQADRTTLKFEIKFDDSTKIAKWNWKVSILKNNLEWHHQKPHDPNYPSLIVLKNYTKRDNKGPWSCDYVQNDKVFIKCQIAMTLKASEAKSNRILVDSVGSEISQDFEKLVGNNTFSDLTIKIGEEEIFVHKVILASRSPVFDALISANKDIKEINISNFDSHIVMKLLYFLYSGTIRSIDAMSYEDVKHLLMAAQNYEVKKLKSICEEILLVHYLSVNNAVELLIFADNFNAILLKERAVSIVVESAKTIGRNELEKLRQANSNLLIDIIGKLSNSIF